MVALAKGETTPSEASMTIEVLTNYLKIIEFDDLEKRLKVLDEKHVHQTACKKA